MREVRVALSIAGGLLVGREYKGRGKGKGREDLTAWLDRRGSGEVD